MKEILKESSRHILLFETGEEVMAELKAYAQKENIRSAWINILGACGELNVAYYDLHTKSYEKHLIQEDLEILSVIGNIAQLNSEPALHLHGTFGKRDLSVIGGHLFSMTVSASAETYLQIFQTSIERAFDERTGLNLMQCRVKG